MSAQASEGEFADSPTEPGVETPARSSWGIPVPVLAPAAALAAELHRDERDPGLLELLDAQGQSSEARALRERGLWSLARIGGPAARDRLLAELDETDAQALAAAALLDLPRAEPGQPADPVDFEPWAALEDGLWTRYAVTDPTHVELARALLLAIGRVGGSRTVARLAVDLAEPPNPAHDPVLLARWSAGMEVLGLLCARGHGLDKGTVEAMLVGLEIRPGVDASISRASLYSLGRCARSSGELLVESKASLVERLSAHVVDGASGEQHAALAWRAFAGLGELPETIPGAILGPNPPPWTVEVEAVRALAGTARGAEVVRERLVAAKLEGFSGPRQHVLIEGLRAMRTDIASAPGVVDAQLVGIAEGLLIGRRSEDPRRRKGAALAICELRLLQAIRSGETTMLDSCEQLTGAPAVDLPLSLLVNLEVEALLRATRPEAPANGTLSVETIDDDAVIADKAELAPVDPGRRARIARLIALARDNEPARAGPALHALAEIDDPSVGPVLRAAMISDDPGILAAAATAVAVRSVDAGKRDPSLAQLLEDIVRTRVEAGEIEARLAAIEALGALGRTAVASIDPNPMAPTAEPEAVAASPWLERSILPLAADPNVAVRRRAREALLGHGPLVSAFDLAEIQAAATRPRAFADELERALRDFLARPALGLRIETSAGIFTIEFAGVPAPINQANLVALAQAGFYSGLSFHRVVPGFVVQGGDPRGDGYGGPGYLVPCEWSNLSYARGTVGIALAGKDTGGSQLFVTQTPQPHLDARYTVIGQIGEGLEVIDSLLPGDRIESVEVLYAADEGE